MTRLTDNGGDLLDGLGSGVLRGLLLDGGHEVLVLPLDRSTLEVTDVLRVAGRSLDALDPRMVRVPGATSAHSETTLMGGRGWS